MKKIMGVSNPTCPNGHCTKGKVTGDYAHSTGYLNIFGATYTDGTAKGKFEGLICK